MRVTAGVAALGGLAIAGLQATQAQAATHYWLEFTNRESGQVANVGFELGDKGERATVRQHLDRGTHDWNNQWEMIPDGDGWSRYKNRWSGKCMEATAVANGAAVVQKTCQNTQRQKWKILYDVPTGDEFFKPIRNKWATSEGKSNLVLTVYNPSKDGSPLMLWTHYYGHSQHWNIAVDATS
ncbi:RICIN domain-containing protein [Kribbella sp. CA-253562]|uniref:RICIN domain-containing protein n=1 Tax=Kribbella sp. CA-253562 TaxID=3239942 RepID=UPI003D8FFA5B